ncbi:MAG: hypothetical protein Q8R47_01645 [Nanoarchaeota archaeon]|nr:hypothetical protein [Nanoarchaeota archaeon]
MAANALVDGILALVDWVEYLIIFMILIEIWKFFSFGGTASTVGGGIANFGKGILNLPKWNARRVQKKEINQYIMEEREEKDLDGLKGEALHILTELEAYANRGLLSFKDKTLMVEMITQFGEMLTETKRTFRQLNKITSRADNGLERMFNYFKKKGVPVPEEVRKLELHIRTLHVQTAQEIGKVEDIYQEIIRSEAMETFKSLVETNFTFNGKDYKIETKSDPFNLTHLHELINRFQDERFLLEDAYKREAEAKKEMTGIIQETRNLYK